MNHLRPRASLVSLLTLCACLFGGDDSDDSGGDEGQNWSGGSADDGNAADDDAATGGASFDGGASGGCSDVEGQLVGKWITPEGSTESSDSYNTLEFFAGGSGHLYMFAYGADMELDFEWQIEADCDEIHYDYGTGWLTEYSVIHQLDSLKLDIEATDGTYYGTRTVYDRLGGGGGGTPTDGTCGSPCVDATSCDAGQACLSADSGMLCMPPDCQACWDQGRGCTYSSATCTVVECGEQDPNFSDTCKQPCGSDVDCNAGEACLDSATGNICLPPMCQGCWDAGQDCFSSNSTCAFDSCG